MIPRWLLLTPQLLHSHLRASRFCAVPSSQRISSSCLPYPPHPLSPRKTNTPVTSTRNPCKAFPSTRCRKGLIFDTRGNTCRKVGVILYEAYPERDFCLESRSNRFGITKSGVVTNGNPGYEITGEEGSGKGGDSMSLLS
jgi:hypothetical protein